MSGFIYIYTGVLHQKNNLYKIGRTCNPRKRLSDLNTSNPGSFYVHTWKVSNVKDSEKMIHKFFRDLGYLYKLEWFKFDINIDNIIGVMNSMLCNVNVIKLLTK